MEGIQVSIEKVGTNETIAVIKVGGYIDTTTSAELEHSLSSVLKSNCYNIIIDLGNVDYISSAGWGVFLAKLKDIRTNEGDLKLANMSENVYEVYRVLEFFWFIRCYTSIEAALDDFDKQVPPMPQ